MYSDDFGIWFDLEGAHASVEVPFVGEDGPDFDVAEVLIDLNVSGWERSIYRRPERNFEIQDIVLREFGRSYHFDLEDLLPGEAARARFLQALEEAHDDHVEDCRADAAADY